MSTRPTLCFNYKIVQLNYRLAFYSRKGTPLCTQSSVHTVIQTPSHVCQCSLLKRSRQPIRRTCVSRNTSLSILSFIPTANVMTQWDIDIFRVMESLLTGIRLICPLSYICHTLLVVCYSSNVNVLFSSCSAGVH